jgi:ABC-type transport system involved in multi-copper enzyme maturation permease subunit
VNLAIIRKTTRDALPLLLIVLLGIMVLETLLVAVVSELSEELEFLWHQRSILQRFLSALVGAEIGSDITATTLMTIGFAHPLLYALTWAFLLVTCSRVIVAEIERGTADLLLTLPVSRGCVYASVSAVWILAGVPLCLTTLLGVWLGAKVFSLPEPLDFSRLAIVGVNFFALYLTIGSATLLASSVVSRRGPAVGLVLAWLLASFLLNFLGQFWSAAEKFGFLGVLHYYRPMPVVRTGDWPVRDLAVLIGLALIFAVAGLWRFARRNIPAV